MTSNWLFGRTQILKRRWFPKRVRPLQQLTTVECGAACLAMILNYFGRPSTVAEAREACVVGRDGLRASTIAQAARRFGLQVRAFRSDLPSLSKVALPAILHWELTHFVVLERWDSRGASIVDPALGRQQIPAGEFSERFSGVVLTFEPTPEWRSEAHSPKPRFWAAPLFRRTLATQHAVPIILLAIATRLLSFSLPFFIWLLVDGALALRSGSLLWALSGLELILIGTGLLTQEILSGFMRQGDVSHQFAGQETFVRHLFRLPVPFFQQRSSGDLLMRTQSAAQLEEAAGGRNLAEAADLATCLLILAGMVVLTKALAGLLMALIVARVLGSMVCTQPCQQLLQEEMRRTSQQQGYLLEVFRGAISLKASASEADAEARWKSLLAAQLNTRARRVALVTRVRLWEVTLGQLAPAAMLLVSTQQVLSGRSTPGQSAAYAIAALLLYARSGKLAALLKEIRDSRGHWERTQDVLTSSPEQGVESLREVPPLQGSIEVRDLSFRFTPDSPWVVRNVSCAVTAGQKIAIVGASGSGKSTLAMLMLGLYQSQEGEVLFDGHSLHAINLQSLRCQTGVVLQDQFLFGGSIRQNIAFGTPRMTLQEVAQAAHFAGIHDEISRMPMGYETVLYESGANLSGGQRQRLLIARAIASRPRLLMLDEATSHLDTVSEAHVDRSLSQLSCTRIVIAHRLSTVRNADQILVMQSGVLVETGTHDDLFARDGEYKKLCSTMV